MPRSTFAYLFELKVLERASGFAETMYTLKKGQNKDSTLVEFETGQSFLLIFQNQEWSLYNEDQEHSLRDLMDHAKEQALSYLFYDPFDAPEYTYVSWQNLSQSLLEDWIESPFEPNDFVNRQNNKILNPFPATWGVMF